MKRQSLIAAIGFSLLAGCTAGAGMDGGSSAGASAQGSASADAASVRKIALARAIAAPSRTPANVARDRYRHPAETLDFFGVDPSDTVVEIWPGGGWYTEILAPYLSQGGGTYYAVAPGGKGPALERMMGANPSLYGNIKMAAFPAWEASEVRVPDGTADVVLTFRNVHNWVQGYQRPDRQDYSPEAFRQIYAMLKPGGTLGIVDHRLPESADAAREKTSGYVKTSTVRRLAEQAGFRFAGASEVNANPKDTADWPDGVWTLPPTLRLKDQDREKYLAIGESDRMTLKFVKPRS
jgi:predicted methyltransferase